MPADPRPIARLLPGLLALSIALGSSAARASDSPTTTIEIPIGSQQLLPAVGIKSYSEGVSGIVDVRLTPEGTHFIVVGIRLGRTSLLMLTEDGRERLYDLRVTQPDATGPSVDYGPGTVAARANIRLDVYFVQLNESYGHQLGMGFPGVLGGADLSASFDFKSGHFLDTTAVITGQALPQLDLAQSDGWAKVLRRAAVVTANGAEAKFSGGGEVNVPVSGGLGTGLHQIEFGSLIRVRPRYDSESGRIELSVAADVSDLANDHGTGVPGRNTAALNTLVNLELGQSLVLAGIASDSQARDHTGIPWLSQIPILGGLFGSHSERSEHMRNVIFIVPTVIDALPASAREDIKRALLRYRDYTGDIDERPLLEIEP